MPPHCGQQSGAWTEPLGGADMGDDTKGRFVKVPLSVVQADISVYAFRLWCCIAARTGRDGRCWPGKQQLVVDSGLSMASVKRSLAELEAAGLLLVEHRRKEGGHNFSNMYTPVDNCGGGFSQTPGGFSQNPGVGSHRAPELESFRTRHKRTSESSRTQHPVDCPNGCDGTGWIETGPRTVNHCPGGEQ